MCANHPQARTSWVCTDCGGRWCGACVNRVRLEAGRTVSLCRACQGLCERTSEAAAKSDDTTFAGGLLRALVYPLQGTALFLVLVVVFLETAMTGTGQFFFARRMGGALPGSLLVLWGIGIGLGAFVLIYLRRILLSSAEGDSRPPAWPEFDMEALKETALQFIAVYLVSFGPWTVCRLWLQPATEGTKTLCYSLLGLGACYFPMALLAVVIYDNLSALNPLLFLVSVVRTFPKYFGLGAFLGTLFGLGYVLGSALASLKWPLLTAALSSFGEVYAAVILMRALGWFYYRGKDSLGWS
jgi:hypothetical protein